METTKRKMTPAKLAFLAVMGLWTIATAEKPLQELKRIFSKKTSAA